MDNEKEKKVDRNASASAYGWVFQVGAGIYLMLDNIKEMEKIKLEGKYEDIEITTSNGKIYAQAKSVTQMHNQSTAISNLHKALTTLKDAASKNDDVNEVIYVTNIRNPFSEAKEKLRDFDYNTNLDFDNLPEEYQQQLSKIAGEDFPFNKFKVNTIRFFGKGKEKMDCVKNKIGEFLSKFEKTEYASDILDDWCTLFFCNAADDPGEKDKTAYVNKKDIVFSLILLLIDHIVNDNAYDKMHEDIDYNTIMGKYHKLIHQSTMDSENYSSLLGHYNSEKLSLSKEEFIMKHWREYSRLFSIADEDEQRAITKIYMLSVINQGYIIEKVRRETSYVNKGI